MNIPGSNLLTQAFRLIAQQTVMYFQFLSRAQNAVGQDITTYAAPVPILGSFQPVPKQMYEKYGLDLAKTYATFYTPTNALSVNRDISGDQIVFNGGTYQCESENDWFAIDGWTGVLCVLQNN